MVNYFLEHIADIVVPTNQLFLDIFLPYPQFVIILLLVAFGLVCNVQNEKSHWKSKFFGQDINFQNADILLIQRYIKVAGMGLTKFFLNSLLSLKAQNTKKFTTLTI